MSLIVLYYVSYYLMLLVLSYLFIIFRFNCFVGFEIIVVSVLDPLENGQKHVLSLSFIIISLLYDISSINASSTIQIVPHVCVELSVRGPSQRSIELRVYCSSTGLDSHLSDDRLEITGLLSKILALEGEEAAVVGPWWLRW